MLNYSDVPVLVEVIKHLAGKHDQKTHGRPDPYTDAEKRKIVRQLGELDGNKRNFAGETTASIGYGVIREGPEAFANWLKMNEDYFVENGLEKDSPAWHAMQWANDSNPNRALLDKFAEEDKEELAAYEKEGAVVHATLSENTDSILKNGLRKGTYVLDKTESGGKIGNKDLHMRAAVEQILIDNNGKLPAGSTVDVISVKVDRDFLETHASQDPELEDMFEAIPAFLVSKPISANLLGAVKRFKVTPQMSAIVARAPITKWWSEKGFDLAQSDYPDMFGDEDIPKKNSSLSALLQQRALVALYVNGVYTSNLHRKFESVGYIKKSESDKLFDEPGYYVITAYVRPEETGE